MQMGATALTMTVWMRIYAYGTRNEWSPGQMAMAIAVGITVVEMRERRGKSDGQDADAWM